MNQQEWIELFESVNGRKPTADELVAAAKAGVIPSPSREKSVRPEVNNQAEADKERPVFSRPAPERDKFGRKLTPPQPSDLERPKPNAVASESPSEQASQTRAQSTSQAGKAVQRVSFGGVHQAPQDRQVVENSNQTQAIPSQSRPEVMAGGSQSTSQTTQKKKSKWPRVLLALVALLFLAFAGAGGYAFWRNNDGNIEGTWQLTEWHYYDQDEDKWVNVLNQYKDKKFHYQDFVIVSKQKRFEEDSYSFSTEARNQPYLPLGSYLNDIYQVNQWDKTIDFRVSNREYKDKVTKLIKSELKGYYSYLNAQETKKYIASIAEGYNYSRSYSVDGDKLTIVTQDKSGRKISEAVYHHLSDAKAESLRSDFKKQKAKFEKNYHIN